MTLLQRATWALNLVVAAVLLVGLASDVHAAFLRDVPQHLTQPDGTKLELRATGDEFYGWLHDANGYVIVRDPESRYYVYARKVAGQVVPTTYQVGTVNPASVGLSPRIVPDREFLPDRTTVMPKQSQPRARALGVASRLTTINNIVVFIKFQGDAEPNDALATYDSWFNASGSNSVSVFNYFKEASYQQVSLTSTFYPTPAAGKIVYYEASNPRAYYEPYHATDNPTGYKSTERTAREHTLLKGAVEAIAAQVSALLDVDTDGDGYVDSITFFLNAPNATPQTVLWPHSWQLYTQAARINGKRVWDYNLELSGMPDVGTLCHELTHVLGAPDLYHYSYDGYNPVGPWDIMEETQYPPQHTGAYMKHRYLGWISSIPVISTSGTYALKPLTSATNNAYKIASPNSANEFFVVEYRKKTGAFEKSVPGSGLLAYRINLTADGLGNRLGPPDEVYVYRPGGTTTEDGTRYNAYYSSEAGRTAINDTTSPSSFLSDGSAGGLSISGVGAAGDTISFTVTVPTGCAELGAFSLTAPAANATLQDVTSANLTWAAGASVTEYDVYFGTTDPPPFLQKTTATTLKVTVAAGSKYFWRVVARNPCAQAAAPRSGSWSFIVASGGKVTLLDEDFEGDLDPLWRLAYTAGAATPRAGWGLVDCKSSSPSTSMWCAGGGEAARTKCSTYAGGMGTFLLWGPFSLADATGATIELKLLVDMVASADDEFWAALSLNGQSGWYGLRITSNDNTNGNWDTLTWDLSDIEEEDYKVIGKPEVWIGCIFISGDSTKDKQGVYIDDVKITKILPSACAFDVTPTTQEFDELGGDGNATVKVISGSSCAWTASTETSWITITSGASGTGDGAITYAVGPNSGAARTGTVTIAGKTLTVKQAALSCYYSLNPTTALAPTTGGSGSFAVTTSATCTWTATPDVTWLHIIAVQPASGTGPGQVRYLADANTGAARAGTITVANHSFTVVQGSPAATHSYWLPVASHAPGKNDSKWRTDLGVLNLTTGATLLATGTANLELRLYTPTGVLGSLAQVPAGGQALFADVVDRFKFTGSAALEVRSDQPVYVTSRTYNLATGTFGQDYPSYQPSQGLAAGQSAYLPQLTENADYRTNIGLANTSTAAASVKVELFAGSSRVGDYTVDLAAGEWKQDGQPFKNRFSRTDVPRGYAKVTVLSGADVVTVASVVDNKTNDPTTVLAKSAPAAGPTTVWLPVAAHNPGKNESQWRTDAGILNLGVSTANVTVRMLASGSVYSTATTVAAGAQSILVDLVNLFPYTGSGAVEVVADQPVIVTSRTYNQAATGTFGQDYEAYASASGLSAGQSGVLAQLAENPSYRSNIGLANSGTVKATVKVELFDGDGIKLGDYTVDLNPGVWKQEGQPFLHKGGRSNLTTAYAKVTVTAGSGVIAVASVIDATTNDPTTFVLLR